MAAEHRQQHVVRGKVDRHGEECTGQHHALHRDIDDAGPFRDDSPECGQQQQRGGLQRGMPQARGQQQLEDIPECFHAMPLSPGEPDRSTSWARAAAAASASGESGVRPTPGSRSLTDPRKLAAMLKRINAWSM